MNKLKQLYDYLHEFLIKFLTPIAFIAGYIYYLITKNQKLSNKIDSLQAEDKIKEDVKQEEVVDAKANDAVANYELIVDQYRHGLRDGLPGRDQGSQSSDSSSKGSDSDPGSKN